MYEIKIHNEWIEMVKESYNRGMLDWSGCTKSVSGVHVKRLMQVQSLVLPIM